MAARRTRKVTKRLTTTKTKRKKEREKSKKTSMKLRRGIDLHMTDVPVRYIFKKDRIIETGTGQRISVMDGHPMLNGIIKPLSVGVIFNMSYRNWHHDPAPQIIVFYSDIGNNGRFVEGLNLRYFPSAYITRFLRFVAFHPNITSRALYNIIKKTYSRAIKLGYRRYLNKWIRSRPQIYKP